MALFSTKIKLVIFSVIVVSLAGAGYFYYFSKPNAVPSDAENPVLPLPKKSLAEDEEYIKRRVDAILANNPNATEGNARDAIYGEIAFNEQNEFICEKIVNAELKAHCHKLFFISKSNLKPK